MRTQIYAALVVAAVTSISPALAGDGEGAVANSQFTLIPDVVAQAPVQSASSVASAEHAQATGTFVTQTSLGTWLNTPHDGGGDNR